MHAAYFLIYYFSEMSYVGDISYNHRRSLAALVSVPGSVSYHLFDCKAMEIVKAHIWQPKHKGNRIVDKIILLLYYCF